MGSHTPLALEWLRSHPHPETVTNDAMRWAEQTSSAIDDRIRQLVEQIAPTTHPEPYPDRRARLSTARVTAVEMAVHELLPPHEVSADQAGWTPLIPDLSDLL